MRKILAFVFVLCGLPALAQSDVIINTTTLYIAEGKYDSADYYLDSLLRVDPPNIDALMMKGNVLLNNTLMKTPPLDIITVDDESIYSEELAGLQTPVVLIPRQDALKVEEIWHKCLDIDSSRLDIREGLCSVYGMADMRDALLAYLPVTARAGSMKGDDFAYLMAQYAPLLSDRGDQEGAYLVFKKLEELYPKMTGLSCLLAEAYHDAGDLSNARIYVDKGISAAKPDIAVCSDALDIYTAEGEYDKELSLLKMAAKDSLFMDYPFYNGLYKYSRNDAQWRDDMQTYLRQFPTMPDSNSMYNAATFMLSKYYTNDYEGFVSLLHFSISDLFVALVAERGMRDFKDSIHPYLVMAQVLIHDRDYTKANAVFTSLEDKKMDDDTRIDYQIQYAYSLYCSGKYDKAIAHWAELNKVPIPYLFASSNYFLGACYLKSGNRDKATGYFKALVASTDESKFAYLAKLQLDKLSVK